MYALDAAQDLNSIADLILALERSDNEAIITELLEEARSISATYVPTIEENMANAINGTAAVASSCSIPAVTEPSDAAFGPSCSSSKVLILSDRAPREYKAIVDGSTQVSEIDISVENLRTSLVLENAVKTLELKWNDGASGCSCNSYILTEDLIFVCSAEETGRKGYIKAYRLGSLLELFTLETDSTVTDMECNDRMLITNDGTNKLTIWDREGEAVKLVETQDLKGISVCAMKLSGSELVTTSSTGWIRKYCAAHPVQSMDLLWEVKERDFRQTLLHFDGKYVNTTTGSKVLSSLDGSLLYVLEQEGVSLCRGFVITFEEDALGVWSLEGREPPKSIALGARPLSLTLEQNGKLVAVSCYDSAIRVLSADAVVGKGTSPASEGPLRTYHHGYNSVLVLAIQNNAMISLHCETASDSGKVFLWELF